MFKRRTNTSTLDEFLVVGSHGPYNKKTELYNYGSGAWKSVDDYPFPGLPGAGVYDSELLYIPETLSFLVIGGWNGPDGANYLSQIAQFKNDKWYDVGRLNVGRAVSFLLIFCFSLFRDSASSGSTTRLSSLVDLKRTRVRLAR